jgi:hypothetical protein
MFKKMLILLAGLLVFSVSLVFTLTDPLQKHSRAGLQIEYPSGSASVFIDDNYLGKAPLLEEKLQSGEYILKIIPDENNLSSLNLPIYLEKGTLTIIVYNPGENPRSSSSTIFELRKRTDKTSAVSFETYPENALISFDNQEVNFSPLTIEPVSPGEHHFLVNLPSYEAQDHSFLVLDGYETKITINLAKNIKISEPVEVKNGATVETIQSKIEQTQTESEATSSQQISPASDSAKKTENVVE